MQSRAWARSKRRPIESLQSTSLIESLVWRSHEIHVSSEIRSQMEILTYPWLTQVLFENSCFQITPWDGDASLIIFWSRSRCCPVCGSEQSYANTGSHPLQSPDLLCFVVNMTCEFHSSWKHDAGRIFSRSRSEELASILRWNLHIVSRRHVDHVFFSANATREFSYVCHWCFLQALWLTLWTTSSQAVFWNRACCSFGFVATMFEKFQPWMLAGRKLCP